MDENIVPCSSNQFDASNSTNHQDGTDLRVRLYIYDWIVYNHHMIIPNNKAVYSPVFNVGLNGEAGMCISLTQNNDRLLIKIVVKKSSQLIQAIQLLSFNKAVLNWEFLDCDGKTFKSYTSLPCRPMSINNLLGIYKWEKEENLSIFSDNAPLHIRLKLSLRYRIPPSSNSTKASDLRSIEILANDMKKLLDDTNHFPDVIVKVGDQSLHAHKAVVLNQLTEIAMLNSESNFKQADSTLHSADSNIGFETIFLPNENAEIFLSVLHYMYSGKIYVSDALDDFGLYEFTKKYKLHELNMELKPSEMHIQSQINQIKLSCTWYVKDYSSFCRGTFNTHKCPSFRSAGATWNVTLFAFRPQTVFLHLQRISGFNRDIQTVFKLKVCNIDGTPHDEREFKHFFKSNRRADSYPNFLATESQFSIGPNLLYHDTLIVGCDLIVSHGQLTSEEILTIANPGLCPHIGKTEWRNNLFNMLENKTFADVSLLVDENDIRVHKAILSARSSVFERMFQTDMTEKYSGNVVIEDISSAVIKHTVNYIYTGLIDNITMQYAPELYYAADKYALLDLKDRCREYIINNLDVEYACDVLILSFLHNDEKLRQVAENIISKRAAQTLLTSNGLELMTHYPHLVHGILESLSAVFCSLPPQDAYLHSDSNM